MDINPHPGYSITSQVGNAQLHKQIHVCTGEFTLGIVCVSGIHRKCMGKSVYQLLDVLQGHTVYCYNYAKQCAKYMYFGI